MHTTGFPLEKSGLPHQLYRHTKIILREKYQETNNPTYYSRILLVFVCAVFKSRSETSSPSYVRLSVCIVLQLTSPIPQCTVFPTVLCFMNSKANRTVGNHIFGDQTAQPVAYATYAAFSLCASKSTPGFFCGCLWPTLLRQHICRLALQPCIKFPDVWVCHEIC